MAGAAAFAAGTAYRKRSSLAFIFVRSKEARDGQNNMASPGAYHANYPASSKKHRINPMTAKQFLPQFYNPNEPPQIAVAADDNNEEESTLSVAYHRNSGSNKDHPRLSFQASTSSVNSTHRPLMIVVDNAVVSADSFSDSYYQSSMHPSTQPYDNRSGNKRGHRGRTRRSSSWKQPGPLTRAIPYMSSPYAAYFCCFVNVISPGFGTLIAAIVSGCRPDFARSEFSPKRTFLWNLLAFALQLVFAPILFGWIYGILWGMEAIERAKLLALSKLADKHQQLQADAADAAEEGECITFPAAHHGHVPHHHQQQQLQQQQQQQPQVVAQDHSMLTTTSGRLPSLERTPSPTAASVDAVTYREHPAMVAKRPASYHDHNPNVFMRPPSLIVQQHQHDDDDREQLSRAEILNHVNQHKIEEVPTPAIEQDDVQLQQFSKTETEPEQVLTVEVLHEEIYHHSDVINA